MARKITERERAAILGSLGAGVVPAIGLHHVQVGRKEEVQALLDDLQRVEQGGAAVRFIIGRYGAGKSFFLNLIKTVALERKLVVVQADLTPDRRLHGSSGQARGLFGELLKNLATRGRAEGGAVTHLVERWTADLSHEVKSAGGTDQDVQKKVVEVCKPLQELVSGYDFATVLGQYYRGYIEQNEALQQAAVRWLRAEYSTKTEARRDLGVRNIIDDDSFYDYLKLWAAFVRIAGYAGLLVCLDELVVLSHRLSHRVARNNNYEILLRIINDCLQGSVQGLGFLFAATDQCLSDPRRGLASHAALATRLKANRFAADGLVDRAGPVLQLGHLTPEDCYVLLSNIRRVQARGDGQKLALPDEALEAYLRDCHHRLGAAYYQTPRETVKDFVGLLSILEQNPAADWRELLKGITRNSVQTQDEAILTAQEDAVENNADTGSAAATEPSRVCPRLRCKALNPMRAQFCSRCGYRF